MFFHMLRQSFLEGRKRKILAAVTVALAATLITTLFTISLDVGDKMAREMKSYGSNIRVVPKSEAVPLRIGGVDYNPLKGRDYLDEADLPKMKDIFWRNNIVGLAPTLRTPVRVGEEKAVPLIGTYFDKPMPLPDDPDYRTGVRQTSGFWSVDGAWPQDDAFDQALVGATLAGRLGLTKGATVSVVDEATGTSRSFTVSGLLTTGGAEDDAVVVPLAVVQQMAGLAGKVAEVEISALTIPENELSSKARRDTEKLSTAEYDTWYCTAYVSSIAHQIEEAVVNASARPIWQVAAGEGAVIGKIQALLLVVGLAAFVSAAMGVSSMMNTTITERAREIGLMKALGAAGGEIYLLFLGEAVIVGGIGGLVGWGLGLGLAQGVGLMVFGSTVTIAWVSGPLVVLVSIAMALAGSALPARAITALMPVEVLHGRR
ncbi:ABC transporter permease [Rhodospirillum rubrum]|uniref:ABC transporter permease n=1 Tax=Rhodospirillum rubrum TaxID=1085 RepID=UPI001907B1FA|nr:ABC transporter permease [Rhodospirillum rubrum]MBK1663890.1 ABC transporter permease [Rhodospirillum rubrum]MBK1676729.1 ABC transporter permease [Rhodospirillum rubrum]